MNKLKIMVIDRIERKYVKSILNNNILDALKQKTEVEDIWILVDTGRKLDYKEEPLKFNYKTFEDYHTDKISEIYNIERPDIILIANDYDYFLRSFVITAKSMKIPIILTFLTPMFEDYLQEKDLSLIKGKISLLRNRSGFIFKKFRFMLKTYKNTGKNNLAILKIIVNEIKSALFYYDQIGKNGCDLILAVGASSKNTLENSGVKTKIIITGNPLFDELLKKIQVLENSAKNTTNKKIVLMTTGLVEHGFVSKKQWETLMRGILEVINTNFREYEFIIKIHPATERLENYSKLLEKLNYKNKIIQTEPLEKVIFDANLIISFGYSGGTWESLLLKKPMIIANFIDYPIEKMPFVKKGILKEAKTKEELKEKIMFALEHNNEKDITDFINHHLYKLDGLSSQRVADAIIELKNTYEK